MKQASLKIKKYAGNVNIVNNNNLNNRILHAMLWSLGVLALCYMIVLGNIIFNIVERKTLDVSARNLSNEVGNLELEYLSQAKNIDVAMAIDMGFQEAKIKQFSTRKSLGSISFINDEL